MAPPTELKRENVGRGAQVEAIDLTLSSSDTEQRSRPPLQQQRLPSYIKNEPRGEPGTNRQVRREHRTPGQPPRHSQSRAPAIHPQDLAQIIETSDSRAIRKLLMDLCKLSPALSGAVARGLAAHSTFAQDVIRQHWQKSQASGSKSTRPSESSGQDARERMKQRLSAGHPAHGSSLHRVRSPSDIQLPAQSSGFQSVPSIKHERRSDLAESDSDLDQYIPRDFPVVQPATPSRLPLRHASRPTTTNNTPRFPSSSQRRAPLHDSPPVKHEKKICSQCRETFEENDEEGVCFYHSGKQINVNGNDVCDDCYSPWEDLGCVLSTHVAAPDANVDSFKRNQPNRSQSPSKRPRIA
jgi:hypothetical protein